MTKELADQIIKRLLDSYPCVDCKKFKKYVSEIRGFWKFTGGYHLKDSDEIINKVYSDFIAHLEAKHLPTKQEWEILRK